MANEINLLDIAPHQVSRDLRGYSVFFYGDPKSGKTTIATKFPRHLLLAFEKGYNAIPGAMAQPINTWGEFRKVLRQLKDEKVKEKFETIIIDTADIAYDYCEKYICANAKRGDGGVGVDSIADIPFGKGYGFVSKEFDDCLRSIVQMGYGLVLISHAADKTFKDEAGNEYNQIVPTLDKRARKIATRLCDIIGYSRAVMDPDTNKLVTKLFMRGTPRYVAGSRFPYTPDVIDFTYEDLVKAIGDSIDKQMAESGADNFTDARNNSYVEKPSLDYDALMTEFQDIVGGLMTKNQNLYAPKIVEITNKILGKGKKFSECTRDQVDLMELVVQEIKTLA